MTEIETLKGNDRKIIDGATYRAHTGRAGESTRKEWLQLQKSQTGKCRYANEPLMVNKWTSKLACIAPARGT